MPTTLNIVDSVVSVSRQSDSGWADFNNVFSREGSLLDFIHDRLRVALRDNGNRHDLIDAVIGDSADDLLEITRRVKELSVLLLSEDGKNLLAGYKRAANILAAEEKKDGRTYEGTIVRAGRLSLDPDDPTYNLEVNIADVSRRVSDFVAADDYKRAISALATLRQPVDAFFEAVLVNDTDPAVRANRLNLLAKLRDTMRLVADFSKVAG